MVGLLTRGVRLVNNPPQVVQLILTTVTPLFLSLIPSAIVMGHEKNGNGDIRGNGAFNWELMGK